MHNLPPDAVLPTPGGLPPNAVWAYGATTRLGADESHFPKAFERLRAGTSRPAEVFPGDLEGWHLLIGVALGGEDAGVVAFHPVRDQLAEAIRRGLRVFVPATIESFAASRTLRLYLPNDTVLAAWVGVSTPEVVAPFTPPTVVERLNSYAVVRDTARALLGTRERHTWPCSLSLEPVTRGQTAGQLRLVCTAEGERVGVIAPSQRERLADLFDAGERGARGAVTLGHGEDGEAWGRVAVY